jgi:hypothetical protein
MNVSIFGKNINGTKESNLKRKYLFFHFKSFKQGKKTEKVEDEGKLAEMRAQQQVAAKAELRYLLKLNHSIYFNFLNYLNIRRRMEDEAKISKVNSLKILNQWRKIMRLAKAEALKKDIEILSQNHERDVDRKDAILQMLDRC